MLCPSGAAGASWQTGLSLCRVLTDVSLLQTAQVKVTRAPYA